jgi:uroporphyrinogen-III synthase
MALRAIVTRPAAQAQGWVDALRERGVDAVALPLIAIHPVADPAPLQAAWARLGAHALVFFVSGNAVAHFFAQRPPGMAWPPQTLAAAPGPGTAQGLREAGVPAACIVEPAADAPAYDSEHLWQQLGARDWRGRAVLIVRGEQGRDWLAEQLRAAGAQPAYLAAYARGAPSPDAPGQALLSAARQAPGAHLWLFSSSEAVRHLAALWPVPAGARALATHPRIADEARAAGFADVTEVPPTPEAVADAVLRAARGGAGASVQSPSP